MQRIKLNLKKPFIERAICEIRYSGTLTYHERRLTLCKEIMEKKREFPQWSLNTPTIQLRDQKEKENSNRIFTISSKGSLLLFRNPGEYENFTSLADYLMTKTIEVLEIDNLIRIGIRIFYFSEINETFEQLKNALITKLFNRKSIESFSGSIKDVASIIEFKNDEYDFNVRIGPLSSEEIKGEIYKGEKYYVLKEKINPSLLVDIDYFKKNCSSKRIRSILKDSKTDITYILNNILSMFKEEP